MKISRAYRNSATKKVIEFLFFGGYKESLSSSYIGNLILKLDNPIVVEILVFSAVSLLWYEGFLSKFFPILGANWLVPLILFAALFFIDKKKVTLNKPLLWYFSFLFFSALSALIASFNRLPLAIFFPGWLIFAQFGVVLFLSQSVKNYIRLLKAIVFASTPLLAISFYQFLSRVKTPQAWVSASESSIQTRVFATFSSPNVLGGVLALVAIFSIFIFLNKKKKIYLIFFLLSIVAIFMTFSRSVWIGLFASAFFIALIYHKKLILYLPLSASILLFSQARERIFTLFSLNYLNDASLDGRLWSLINGWYIFKNNFVFGTGPGSYGGQIAIQNASPVYLTGIQNGYTALYYTDNQWLEILVQTGVLGFVSLVGFFISVLVLFSNYYKKSGDIMTLAGISSVIFFIVMGFFANVLEFGAISLPLAIIIGSLLHEKESSNSL